MRGKWLINETTVEVATLLERVRNAKEYIQIGIDAEDYSRIFRERTREKTDRICCKSRAMGSDLASNPIKEIAEEEPFDLQMICPMKD